LSHSTPSPHGNDAEIKDILRRTRFTLDKIELYLEGFPTTPDRRRTVAAMHNIVVTGRMVTFVLQNLRSKVQDFDVWYKPWEDEMREDPLLQYFKGLRNNIEKQGREGVVSHTYINSFNSTCDMPPTPPGAVAFFIGDENGGSGWKVQLEDGSTQKIYIELPERIGCSWFSFEDLPHEHLGSQIAEDTLEGVSRLYVQYLQRLVEAAERKFSPA
jgi:hypothetical protein